MLIPASTLKVEVFWSIKFVSSYFSLRLCLGSLNKVLQEDQMDVHFRFWDNDASEVSIRFYDSHFLKRANAKNLFQYLQSSLKDVTSKNLLQFSMDGPNTNWKALELLDDDREENDYPTTLNIASRGLYVIHGAFKTGVESTDSALNKILRAMWKVFDGSSARRYTYNEICEVCKFPLKYILFDSC